jgi:hypothetical protein
MGGAAAVGGRSIRYIVRLPLGAMKARLGGRESVQEEKLLPKFDYYIEESFPDVVVLLRQDGAFAAAFSAKVATTEGILKAAKEDYRRLLEANADLLGLREDGERKRSA